MSLFVLKVGFKLVLAPSGNGSIVHVRTGDELTLTSEHANILERASQGGVDAADPWLSEIVETYRSLGILVPKVGGSVPEPKAPTAAGARSLSSLIPPARSPPGAFPPAVADSPPVPAIAPVAPLPIAISSIAPLAIPSVAPIVAAAPAPAVEPRPVAVAAPTASAVLPEHAVPCLSPALIVDTKAGSPLIHVTDPVSAKSFPLYDFEVTLARMLDGRRSHAEVVEAARHIGLPVTFDSLVRFIRELQKYGFLSPAGTQAVGESKDTTWPAREAWDGATRALYQSGLRMHRQGRYQESAAYFEAMLVENPKNEEALEMLKQAKQRASQPPTAALTPLPDVSDKPLEQFDELSLDDAPKIEVPGAVVAASSPPPPPAIAPLVPMPEPVAPVEVVQPQAAPVPPPPQPAPQAQPPPPASRLPMVFAAIALTALVGIGWKVLSPAQTVAVVTAPIRPPGVVPVQVPVPPEVVAVAVVDAGIQLPVQAQLPIDAGVAVVEVAAVVVDAGTVAIEVPSGAPQWQVVAITRRGRVKMGEAVPPGAGVINWKVASEQRVKKGELLAVVQTVSGEQRLVAPVQGLVIRAVAEGELAELEKPAAEILYHEAYLQAVVTGAQPAIDWACEVVDEASAQKSECTIGKVVPRGAGFFVTAVVLPRWFDAAANPKLRIAPR